MKTYPSIIHPQGGFLNGRLHTFAKLDGSNIRFEWSKKRGWYKAGTRRRLLDETDPIFKPALPLFHETLATVCEKVCVDQRWQRAIVYCEYYGPQSFAGLHVEGDTMQLTCIDVAPYKKGLLPPTEFLKLFGAVGPYYLGFTRWGREFVLDVLQGNVEGATFEGVVGKRLLKKKLQMFKAKTQAWKDAVKARFPQEASRIIAS